MKELVELAEERDVEIPALVYEARPSKRPRNEVQERIGGTFRRGAGRTSGDTKTFACIHR